MHSSAYDKLQTYNVKINNTFAILQLLSIFILYLPNKDLHILVNVLRTVFKYFMECLRATLKHFCDVPEQIPKKGE